MALALDHFIRGALISSGVFIFIFTDQRGLDSGAPVADIVVPGNDIQQSTVSDDSLNTANSPVSTPTNDMQQSTDTDSNVLPQDNSHVSAPTVDNSLDSGVPSPRVDDSDASNIVQNTGMSSDAPVVDDQDDQDVDPENSTNNDELNEKLKERRIDESCFLKDLKTVGKCYLNEEQMKVINFPEKDEFEEDTDLTITGLEGGKTVTLTIEAGYDEDDFHKGGLRLTFNNPNEEDVIIQQDSSKTILKPHIDYDYKFSYAIEKWLDRAWKSLQKLGDRVGLNINDVLEGDTCTGGNTKNKINVWRNKGEYVIGADNAGESVCPMEAEGDVPNLLEGFKFKVRGEKDVPLRGGSGPDGGTTIDALRKNSHYSVAPRWVNGNRVWFLVEKS